MCNLANLYCIIHEGAFQNATKCLSQIIYVSVINTNGSNSVFKLAFIFREHALTIVH